MAALLQSDMIKLHVLFADGEAGTREMIARALKRDPLFVARGCAGGLEVSTAGLAWRPDLALLDFGMPGLDGPGLLRRLRADARTAAIRVVFMTEPAQADEWPRLKVMGAAGMIAKPLVPERLAAELRRYVPVEGVLAAARQDFLRRLDADAGALWAARPLLSERDCEAALIGINRIAHALAGAAGIYGFAGITGHAAALSAAAEDRLAGRARHFAVERALDRLLQRIGPIERLSAA